MHALCYVQMLIKDADPECVTLQNNGTGNWDNRKQMVAFIKRSTQFSFVQEENNYVFVVFHVFHSPPAPLTTLPPQEMVNWK